MRARITENPNLRDSSFVFQDRVEAGRLLAEKLRDYSNKKKVLLFAIPNGGVPVGNVIAQRLNIPLDVLIVRKGKVPWNTEAGFGAIVWDGDTILNEELVKQLGMTEQEIDNSIIETKRTIKDRLKKFRGNTPMPNLEGKVIILIDDGLASGFTMMAAARFVRKRNPEKIIVAVPTASPSALELLSPEADEIVCLNIRTKGSFAVAEAYRNWYDLTDEEASKILEKN
jgi:predicted phosphoribosyltransferase